MPTLFRRPARFSPQWLTHPATEAELLAGQAQWRTFQNKATRWWMVSVVGCVVGLLGSIALAMAGHQLASAQAMMGTSLAALVMTIAGLMDRIADSWVSCLNALPEEKRAEFRWLIEHAEAGQALRTHLLAQPRDPREGELYALQSAYAEAQRAVRSNVPA